VDRPTSQQLGNLPGSILVIDDDVIMREVLSMLLEESGQEVLTAESGDGALALLSTLAAEQFPGVMLVDLKMPGLSHGALAVRLRVACPPALLIAMSGSGPSTSERAAFDEFLLKPFAVADVYAAIARARQPSTALPKAEQPPRAKAALQADAVIDQAIYSKLAAVMGPAELPQLYNMFLDDAPTRIDRMRTAAAAGDEAAFVREAHTLKGGCGMLGATELLGLAARAEADGLASSLLLDDFKPAMERVRSILVQHANLRT
jgi:CheY-like chemotaxis protein/HPt (histidine-containing phosphotransfer) domain-containing protein